MLCHGGIKLGIRNGAPARTCTSSFGLRRTACRTLTLRELLNKCAMPVLPRRFIFGRDMCCSYTNGANEWKMVAASGSAPDSPRLQRGADLSQLHSQVGPSARFRAAVGRLSIGCSAIELQRE